MVCQVECSFAVSSNLNQTTHYSLSVREFPVTKKISAGCTQAVQDDELQEVKAPNGLSPNRRFGHCPEEYQKLIGKLIYLTLTSLSYPFVE